MGVSAYSIADGVQRKRERDPLDTIPVDRGCGGLCKRSLECPYPVCLLEKGGFRVQDADDRQQLAVEMSESGLSAREIAFELGVTRRTVVRYLAAAKG